MIVKGILHERCWHCSKARHWGPDGEIHHKVRYRAKRWTTNLCPRNGVEICASPTKPMLHSWNLHAFGERHENSHPLQTPSSKPQDAKTETGINPHHPTSPSLTFYRQRNSASIYLLTFSSGRPPHICVRHTVSGNLYQPLRSRCRDSLELLTVSTMIPVIWYGSALLAGLLSSK